MVSFPLYSSHGYITFGTRIFIVSRAWFFLAPIKRELSEMIIIFKIKKKNFKTAFFWPEDKRIKTAIFGKNNYQHCVGS